MDAMVTKVRIVMVSPPWLSPRPLRTDAAWRGHGGWRWRIFETRYGGFKILGVIRGRGPAISFLLCPVLRMSSLSVLPPPFSGGGIHRRPPNPQPLHPARR